jgi:hypothetical protein
MLNCKFIVFNYCNKIILLLQVGMLEWETNSVKAGRVSSRASSSLATYNIRTHGPFFYKINKLLWEIYNDII